MFIKMEACQWHLWRKIHVGVNFLRYLKRCPKIQIPNLPPTPPSRSWTEQTRSTEEKETLEQVGGTGSIWQPTPCIYKIYKQPADHPILNLSQPQLIYITDIINFVLLNLMFAIWVKHPLNSLNQPIVPIYLHIHQRKRREPQNFA